MNLIVASILIAAGSGFIYWLFYPYDELKPLKEDELVNRQRVWRQTSPEERF